MNLPGQKTSQNDVFFSVGFELHASANAKPGAACFVGRG
jgi:hypothetical protein